MKIKISGIKFKGKKMYGYQNIKLIKANVLYLFYFDSFYYCCCCFSKLNLNRYLLLHLQREDKYALQIQKCKETKTIMCKIVHLLCQMASVLSSTLISSGG